MTCPITIGDAAIRDLQGHPATRVLPESFTQFRDVLNRYHSDDGSMSSILGQGVDSVDQRSSLELVAAQMGAFTNIFKEVIELTVLSHSGELTENRINKGLRTIVETSRPYALHLLPSPELDFEGPKTHLRKNNLSSHTSHCFSSTIGSDTPSTPESLPRKEPSLIPLACRSV